MYGAHRVAVTTILAVTLSGCWSFPEDRLFDDASSTDAMVDAQSTDFITQADSTAPEAGEACGNGMIDPDEDCEAPFDPCCDSTTCRYKAPGAGCRASVGECDAAEACSGTEATCPADGFAAEGSDCTDSNPDDCSVAQCNSDGSCDQSAAAVPDGTGCSNGSGTCQGGVCDTDNPVCGNGILETGEKCESPFAPCCNSATCQLMGEGTVCRASTGTCDADETCSGTVATCPSDKYAAAGTVCRSAAGECDVAEACTGVAASCPQNGFIGIGAQCSDSTADDCKDALCDGSGSCDQNAADQTDGTVCNGGTGTCLAGTCQAGGVDPKIGNVLYFSFDDGTAADLSGNGHHGTISGAMSVPGKIGLALGFDGSNDYVQVADHPQLFLGNTLTIEAWLHHTNSDDGHAIYSDYVDSQTPESEANVQLQTNGLIRFISNSGCSNEKELVTSAAGIDVPLHAWIHLAVTWDGSNVRFYLDGSLQDTQPFSHSPCQKPNTAFRVGRRPDGNRVFEGLIDELKVSNYAKTEAQIQQSMSHVSTGNTSPFLQDTGSNGIVSMEAENNHDNVSQGNHDWIADFTSGYSGTGALMAYPNNGTDNETTYETDSPRLDFKVNFVKTGTHYVWVRGWYAGWGDNTCHAGLDGNGVSTANRIVFGAQGGTQWHWTKSSMDPGDATINVPSTGEHTVNLWMGEDGLIVDKIVLTTSSSYTPSGTGPTESPR